MHVLVNNASGFGVMDNEDGWAAGFGVDVMAAVRATWKVAPWIAEAGGGSIVHISSISGLEASSTPSLRRGEGGAPEPRVSRWRRRSPRRTSA